jgi:hypothetical protein
MCACNIKTKKNGNWLGPVMDLFGRLLDLSLENNAFPAALMDLFQKNSSRLIKLIVTARPNLLWHYGSSYLPPLEPCSPNDQILSTERVCFACCEGQEEPSLTYHLKDEVHWEPK